MWNNYKVFYEILFQLEIDKVKIKYFAYLPVSAARAAVKDRQTTWNTTNILLNSNEDNNYNI